MMKQERTGADNYDSGTLLGLYHGYDQARRVLERLARHYRYRACEEGRVAQELSLCAGEDASGHRPIFEQVAADVAALEGLNRGAQTAVLSAFALVSDKAEELRQELMTRCPELRDIGEELASPPGAGH